MPGFQEQLQEQVINRLHPGQTKGTQNEQSWWDRITGQNKPDTKEHDVQPLVTYGPPAPEGSSQKEYEQKQEADADAARNRAQQEAELRKAQADADLAGAKAREATSPAAARAAELAEAKARIDLKVAELNLQKANDPNQSPVAIARLEAQLANERAALDQQFQAQMQDARFAQEARKLEFEQSDNWARMNATNMFTAQEKDKDRELTVSEGTANRSLTASEGLAGRELTREQNSLNREAELQRTRLTTGVQLRGQELDRLQAIDQFTTNTIANQIRKGELDVDRGYKVMQSAIAAHRLPSEITANIGQALSPFVPHLSSYKAGEIPLGFASGGPFETALRQGGATSYDPSEYAAKPVSVDLFGIAKHFGASSPGKLPDPNKIIPSTGGISAGGGPSALSGFEMPQELQQQLISTLDGIYRGGK